MLQEVFQGLFFKNTGFYIKKPQNPQNTPKYPKIPPKYPYFKNTKDQLITKNPKKTTLKNPQKTGFFKKKKNSKKHQNLDSRNSFTKFSCWPKISTFAQNAAKLKKKKNVQKVHKNL